MGIDNSTLNYEDQLKKVDSVTRWKKDMYIRVGPSEYFHVLDIKTLQSESNIPHTNLRKDNDRMYTLIYAGHAIEVDEPGNLFIIELEFLKSLPINGGCACSNHDGYDQGVSADFINKVGSHNINIDHDDLDNADKIEDEMLDARYAEIASSTEIHKADNAEIIDERISSDNTLIDPDVKDHKLDINVLPANDDIIINTLDDEVEQNILYDEF